MRHTNIIMVLAFVDVALGPIAAVHAEPTPSRAIQVDADADVAPFFHSGYSAHVGVKLGGLPHWRFGAAMWSFDEPSGFVTFLASGNSGFTVSDHVAAATATYYFGDRARGLFAEAFIGGQDQTLGMTGASGSAHVDELLFSAVVGYQWFPTGGTWFLEPSVGASTTPEVAGSTGLAGRTFDDRAVSPIFFAHLGVEL
jgi:hypothetical protein